MHIFFVLFFRFRVHTGQTHAAAGLQRAQHAAHVRQGSLGHQRAGEGRGRAAARSSAVHITHSTLCKEKIVKRSCVVTFSTFPFRSSVAVEFLDSKTFCKNSRHIKGEALMRKRHLEMLGYRVVQVNEGHHSLTTMCVLLLVAKSSWIFFFFGTDSSL